jgi:ribosomal protein S16
LFIALPLSAVSVISDEMKQAVELGVGLSDTVKEFLSLPGMLNLLH